MTYDVVSVRVVELYYRSKLGFVF